jgi:rubrerythrin
MLKHCPKCNILIDDVMGIWQCPICGSDLIEGYKDGARIRLCFV